MAVTPADIGARVSVRRVLRDGREGLGDVVGDLVAWDADGLAVRRRDGSLEVVAEADVVAAKVVPPAPQR
ncbi:MAG: hypothetical protein QOE45_3371 [Frankiaceae bacterium]|nr:hypothetical protein [Frankiaceae bacterium]